MAALVPGRASKRLTLLDELDDLLATQPSKPQPSSGSSIEAVSAIPQSEEPPEVLQKRGRRYNICV